LPVLGISAFATILILSVAFAFTRGGAPERWGALVIATMAGIQISSAFFAHQKFHSVDLGSVVVDSYGVIGFGAIALYARRAWPIWATALQILSLSSHFARQVDAGVSPMVYALMKSSPTFFVLLALFAGTVAHRRRLRVHGSDPGWMDW
jgi:hypothetical protein